MNPADETRLRVAWAIHAAMEREFPPFTRMRWDALGPVTQAAMIARADAALAAMPGWQPIETAPKDGTRILAWARGTDESGAELLWMGIIKWYEPIFETEHRWGVKAHWAGLASAHNERRTYPDGSSAIFPVSMTPTHWMPAPVPPLTGDRNE